MGFSIGGLLKDVGISLPKIDLGSIGKTVLDEGKKLLGEVVKDSFTLSNKPGETFADNMNLNILGDNIRLPNPIGSLANKLLGAADGELNKFGVNLDFKTILGKLFNLPTEQGSSVSVPPVKQRMAQVATPAATAAAGANATGGGAAVSANNAVAGSGANAVGGASSTVDTTTDPNNEFATIGNAESNLLGDLEAASSQTPDDKGMITVNGKKVNAQAYFQMLQVRMQALTEMMNTLSNILKDAHDSRMNTIMNIRG